MLKNFLGEENAETWLNPSYRSGYFAALEALPISGNLTINRVVSVKTGETRNLSLSLPYYDRDGGTTVLTYNRENGVESYGLESEMRSLRLSWTQEKPSADSLVLEGAFTSEPGSKGTGRALRLNFSVNASETESRDTEGLVHCDLNVLLKAASVGEKENALWIPETEVALKAGFVSKELKSAATEMQAELTIGGEGQGGTLRLTLEGRTRKKWTPDAIPENTVEVSSLNSYDTMQLAAGAAQNLLPLAQGMVQTAPGEGWTQEAIDAMTPAPAATEEAPEATSEAISEETSQATSAETPEDASEEISKEASEATEPDIVDTALTETADEALPETAEAASTGESNEKDAGEEAE